MSFNNGGPLGPLILSLVSIPIFTNAVLFPLPRWGTSFLPTLVELLLPFTWWMPFYKVRLRCRRSFFAMETLLVNLAKKRSQACDWRGLWPHWSVATNGSSFRARRSDRLSHGSRTWAGWRLQVVDAVDVKHVKLNVSFHNCSSGVLELCFFQCLK